MFTLALLVACNSDPGETFQQVGYRNGLEPGTPNSGERGSVKISEVLWSGAVRNDGTWDPTDVFIELRNESARPVNVSNWQIRMEGTHAKTYVIPQVDWKIGVGQHVFIAHKSDGCFPDADWVMPELELPFGDPFRLTLVDADERLMEPAGDKYMPPFAGGYDLRVSRSMEKAELMFGARGGEPHAWHYYTDAEVDVPNNDRIAEGCRERTLASPGRPNSPDYSGSFSSGEAF
jgi:hypothetical protein